MPDDVDATSTFPAPLVKVKDRGKTDGRKETDSRPRDPDAPYAPRSYMLWLNDNR